MGKLSIIAIVLNCACMIFSVIDREWNLLLWQFIALVNYLSYVQIRNPLRGGEHNAKRTKKH